MSDLEIKTKGRVTRIVATVFIILSGIILYLDKIFTYYNIEIENLHGWSNQENYIWSLTQTISPVLIILGSYLRPYIVSFIIPIFCYVLQFFFVQKSSMIVDDPLMWIYIIGSSILILLVIIFLRNRLNYVDQVLNIKMGLMEKIIEVDNQILKEKDEEQNEKEKGV